eukprot:733759-Rhodomonas_salina.2
MAAQQALKQVGWRPATEVHSYATNFKRISQRFSSHRDCKFKFTHRAVHYCAGSTKPPLEYRT